MEELSHQLLNHRFLTHNRLLLIQAAATILMHTALPHVELMSSDTFPEVKHQNAKALNYLFMVLDADRPICFLEPQFLTPPVTQQSVCPVTASTREQ